MTFTADDEITYWLTNRPTIAEMRRLNRESLFAWPIDVLMALMDAGVDIEKESDSVLHQFPVVTDELVDMQIVVTRDGKPIAVLGCGERPDGSSTYFAVKRRRNA